MPLVRRVLGAAAALLVVIAVLTPSPSVAQDTAVTLRLLEQSPWCAGYHRGRLDLKLSVFNGGASTLGHLSLVVSFGPRIATQAEFQQMLTEGVPDVTRSVSKTVHGKVEPGGSKTLEMTAHLKGMDEIDQLDSQVYPAAIQLLADGIVVASLVTPVIYLVRLPEEPLRSSVWVQLPAPIAFGADGTLVDGSFPAAIAHGGALRAPLDAVGSITGPRHPNGAMDLVVDPMVITQARDLADGYRTADGTEVPASDPSAKEAARFVAKLGAVASDPDTVETVALPYGDPVLPAMLNSGLSGELARQRAAGATVVAAVPPGLAPVGAVVRPNGGRLSAGALDWLADGGKTNIVLADAGTVDRSRWQGQYAPSPTVPFTSASGSLTMVLPDPATQALFDDTALLDDPVRASQIVLGELALIWKQLPVPSAPTVRGVAIAPPPTLPADLWAPMLTKLKHAPFLTPVTATQLTDQVNPPNPNGSAALAASDDAAFDPAYAGAIDRLTHSVETYSSMLPSGSQIPTELQRKVYVSTAAPYLVDPVAGQPWHTSVDDTTADAFNSVLPQVKQQTFTFTSREGQISFALGDPGATPLQVIVELESNSFTFPEGNRQSVNVDHPGTVVSFPVVAQASGANSIGVFVRAPNGQQLPETGPPAATIVVRTTAVNHIALLVTIGAAIGLVALYARRWVRRRRNPT
jgi:hypothetical protein